MATTTVNSITLTYPDEPCPVFGPCIFTLSGVLERTEVHISHLGVLYEATYQTHNGGTLDLREFLKAFFTSLQMGDDIDYSQACKASELGKDVNITLRALDSDNTLLAQFNITLLCVWGAQMPWEDDYWQPRKIVRFGNYPLTVGVYASNSGGGSINVVDMDDLANSVSNAVATDGIFNVLVDLVPTGHEIEVDYVWVRMGHPVTVPLYYIETVGDCFKDGVYLRWVDRRGMWSHWMFKRGNPTVTAASKFGMWYRNDYSKYDIDAGWQGASGRRQSFTRNDVQPLCAPLVDQETFDMLQDITTSPCVDMFLGYDVNDDPMWTAVTVEAGSYTKEATKSEQDFVFNLILPEVNIQTL